MHEVDALLGQLPNLRRYANAATGSVEQGDDAIADVIEIMIDFLPQVSDEDAMRDALYAALTQHFLKEQAGDGAGAASVTGMDTSALGYRGRIALLLMEMEKFCVETASQFMDPLPEGINDNGRPEPNPRPKLEIVSAKS